jgi:transposase
MRDLAARGFLTKAPSWNAVIDYMDDPALEPVLTDLIQRSAEPLAAVETKFAIDSSGFSTCNYMRWFDEKYGREQSQKLWIKAHLSVGVNTQIVTAVKITDKHDNDCPELPGLLATTQERFEVTQVLADKAYSSYENLATVEAAGAMPLVPFRAGSVMVSKSHRVRHPPPIWRKMLGFFLFQRDEFCRHYNQRSNVETTFSMIKRKFGQNLRAKTTQAQRNELLAKILCHNVAVLIHETYELGIAPLFWQEAPAAQGLPANDDARKVIPLHGNRRSD